MVGLFLTFESLTIVPIGIYIYMSMFFLYLLHHYTPFQDINKNRMELLNETIVYFSMLLYLPFIK